MVVGWDYECAKSSVTIGKLVIPRLLRASIWRFLLNYWQTIGMKTRCVVDDDDDDDATATAYTHSCTFRYMAIMMMIGVVATIIIIIMMAATSTSAYLQDAHAEPSVEIIMEKTTYSYCEKLIYIIQVSEVTGQPAIIHITDETSMRSSAIPIPIEDTDTLVPSNFAFEQSIFPLGMYVVDVQYSGAVAESEFVLIDSGKICIPELMKPIVNSWITGEIIDGFLISAFQNYVDSDLINIPFEINEDNIYQIDMPNWTRIIGAWWLEGWITDESLANVLNYLIEVGIISTSPARSNTAVGT